MAKNPHELLAFWDFNDADSANVSVDSVGGSMGGMLGATYSADALGRTGQAGDTALDTSAGPFIVSDESLQVVEGTLPATQMQFLNRAQAADAVTFSFWQKLNSVTNSSSLWAVADGAGGERAAQVHVPWSNGTIYFDTAGCCDDTQRIAGPPPRGA